MNTAELIADTLFLSNTVTTQYKEIDLLRNLNIHYDGAVSEIWKADAGWRYDEGVGTLPVVWTNLVKDQEDYQIPSEARKIESVEVVYKKNRYKLKPISPEELNVMEMKSGQPKYYYMKGRSVFLVAPSDIDIEDGLYLYLSKSVTKLTGVDPDEEPKIDREFRRYLSVGAAKDWYFSKGNVTKSREMERELNRTKEDIKTFYANRQTDYKTTIKVKRQNYK